MGAENPRERSQNGERRRASRERQNPVTKELFVATRKLHEEHGDKVEFRKDFSDTTQALRTLMEDVRQGYVDPDIAAEIAATEVAAERRARREAEKISMTDPLTGALNRRGLDDQLKRIMSHADRTGEPVTLVELDLDHFKRINDVHGHPAGDQVIKRVVALAGEQFRESDVIARAGGEEFYVVLPNTTQEQARPVMDRFRRTMPGYLREGLRDQGTKTEHPLTGSFGMAELRPDVPIAQTMEQVDLALYAAKRGGRNQLVSYEEVQSRGQEEVDTLGLSLAVIKAKEAEEIAKRERAQQETLGNIPESTRWMGDSGDDTTAQ